MSLTAAITLQNITLTFGKRTIFTNVSFQIEPGEIVALLGPNGAGKSSLLNCIVGAISPDVGQIFVMGQPFFQVSNLSQKIGFVRGSSGLDKGISVKNALHVSAVALGAPLQHEENLLKLCGIFEIRKQKIKTLSTGEKQRLAIAIALLPNPKVLILDEPQNGLDAEGMIWFRNLLLEISKNGGSVLLATHYLSEVELIADRIAIIDRGLLQIEDKGLFSRQGSASIEEVYLERFGSSLQSPEEI